MTTIPDWGRDFAGAHSEGYGCGQGWACPMGRTYEDGWGYGRSWGDGSGIGRPYSKDPSNPTTVSQEVISLIVIAGMMGIDIG